MSKFPLWYRVSGGAAMLGAPAVSGPGGVGSPVGLLLALTYTAAFSPLSLSPDAWYDPSDLSTLWKDTAGTTPVTTDGDAVARVDDKSGNGYHLLQGTAGNRPLYKTSGGLHWLEFDGVDDWLGVNFSLSGTTFHGYFATRQIGGDDYGRLLSLAVDDATNDWDGTNRAAAIQRNVATDDFIGYRNSSALTAGITLTDATDYVVDVKFDGTNYRIRSNGSTSLTAASSGTFATTRMVVGAHVIDSLALSCRVYGFVAFVTPVDSASLVTWLGNKAGLSL